MTAALDHLPHALAYAAGGWQVFPLRARSKVPAIPAAHPPGDPLRGQCKGACGREGHGVLDATRDPDTVTRWWTSAPAQNIGGRVPEGLFVLDIDPRHGGIDNLVALIAEHGGHWNRTRRSETGGGGYHLLFEHPGGRISQSRLPSGVEVKTSAGYIVLPPSRHPDGPLYRWTEPERPIVAPVPWLVALLRPAPAPDVEPIPRRTGAALWRALGGNHDGVADWFGDHHRWADVLVGWALVAGDGEHDGSAWRHPRATSAHSATVQYGLLFNYSPNAGLPITEPGNPAGLTKFRAWAYLEHHGDLSAAWQAALALKKARAA